MDKGTYGVVYKAILKDSSTIVIKEAFLYTLFPNLFVNGKQFFSAENIILHNINETILQKLHSPHFLFFYDTFFCDSCVIKRYFDRKTSQGKCFVTFMEAADGNLTNTRINTFEEQKSILYQLLLALHTLHTVLSIVHYDIQAYNIFFTKIKPGGFWKYTVGSETFYVQNMGYIVYVADFGVVKSFDIKQRNVLGDKYVSFGDRIEIKQKSNGNLYAVPVLDDENVWIDSFGNVVKERFSSSTINISQPNKFPPFEFFFDIQDVLRMFVNGRRSTQKGIHNSNFCRNKTEINNLFSYNNAIVERLPRDVDAIVKYILAIEMLKTLYSPYLLNIKKEEILDHFVL